MADEHIPASDENVVDYWLAQTTEFPELSRLASFLLGAKVSVAFVTSCN